jgi:hypothetical protein
MAQLDKIHNAVKKALVKDDWTITADPYEIRFKDIRVYADLAAERPFTAERNGEKIVVEAKSFVGRSSVSEFEKALGQYNLYLSFLEETLPEYKLFLAISDKIKDKFFNKIAIRHVIKRFALRLIVIDLEKEEIVEWIN